MKDNAHCYSRTRHRTPLGALTNLRLHGEALRPPQSELEILREFKEIIPNAWKQLEQEFGMLSSLFIFDKAESLTNLSTCGNHKPFSIP